MICTAKNGCNSDITFQGKKVYFDWEYAVYHLRHWEQKLDKTDILEKFSG